MLLSAIENFKCLWKHRYENEVSVYPPGTFVCRSIEDNFYCQFPQGVNTSYKDAYKLVMTRILDVRPGEYTRTTWINCDSSDIDNIKLNIAAANGWEKLVESLILIGISPDPFPNSYWLNALMTASLFGQIHIVKYLTILPNLDLRYCYIECAMWSREASVNNYKEVVDYFNNLL